MKLDSEINAGYFFSIEDGKIMMRTCQGYIDYTRIVAPFAVVGNEIMQEGINEISTIFESGQLAAQMTPNTRDRHEIYFGKVIAHTEVDIDGGLLRRVSDGRLNLQKAAIIERHYEIVSGVSEWDGVGYKVNDTVHLVWK